MKNTYSPILHGLMTQAFTLHQGHQYARAEQLYQAILQLDPGQVDAIHFLGVLEGDRGNDELAVRYFRKALAINPRMAPAYVNLGSALRRMKRLDEALDCYDRAIDVQPDFALAYFNRGNVLRDMGRVEDAFNSFREAARRDPTDPDAYNSCGSILWSVHKYEESLPFFDQALAIDPSHVDVLINKGSTLEKMGREGEALEIYDQVLMMQPDHVVAIVNRGAVLEGRGFAKEALQHYVRAQSYSPDDVNANLNEGFCRLKLGDYATGWEKYEWRWRGPQEGHVRVFAVPRWDGESLEGKTILLHAEQGFGDTLQFCRYASSLAQRGARVVLEVQPALVALLETLDGASRVIARGEPLPAFDLHCPLLSVPWLVKTRVDSIPAHTPYLSSLIVTRDKWADTVSGFTRKRIGITWGTTTKDAKKRVLPVYHLNSLFDCDCDFFVAQKDVCEIDEVHLSSFSNVHIFSTELNDFSDTAALLSHMDVVITIDTSIAHLAGALGLPVWVVLPYAAEWRWFEHREDSPWYPTARLFRQPAAGDWHLLIQGVRDALNDLTVTDRHS